MVASAINFRNEIGGADIDGAPGAERKNKSYQPRIDRDEHLHEKRTGKCRGRKQEVWYARGTVGAASGPL